MSDKLTALGTVSTLADADLVYVVDVSDPTDDPAGSSFGITKANLRTTLLSSLTTLSDYGITDAAQVYKGVRTLPTTADSYVELFSTNRNAGAVSFVLHTTVSDTSFSVAKTVVLSVKYANAASYEIIKPISDSGVYGGNDYRLEISVANALMTVRAVRVSGATVGTLNFEVWFSDDAAALNYTSLTGTGTSTATVTFNPQDADTLEGNSASAFQAAGTYNTVIGTDADINYTGATVPATVTYTDGVATAHTSRTLTPANIGALADTTDTLTGTLTVTTAVATNTISERTAAAGVTIDGVLIKDGLVDGKDVSTLVNYTLPTATATTLGGIELFSNTDNPTAANAVTSTAGRTYGIQLNAANQAVVNVPWTDTQLSFGTTAGTAAQGNDSRINNGQTAFGWGDHASEGYASAATTLAGYGITDAYTQAQVNALTWDFATDITSKPTTLSGYGITDGLLNTTDTLTGTLTVTTAVSTNTISERTAAAGVTIDGLLIKDGLVDGRDITALDETDYRYNTGTSTISRVSNFTVIQNWSNVSPTYTLNSTGWSVGDIVTFSNVRTANGTMTVAATRIYLPDGNFDTSVFLTTPGRITLAKYTATAGYWMVLA